MKNQKQIKKKLEKLKKKLDSEKKLYRKISQIKMEIGNVGVPLSSNIIDKTKGEIKALEWVLNNN